MTTLKQKLFIENYEGNATEAAKKAGYHGNDKTLAQIGYENLNKLEIRTEIEKRTALVLEPIIADRQSRKEFWTAIMIDPGVPLRDRLKASELLAKSEGDFLPAKEIDEKEPSLLDIVNRLHERRKERGLPGPEEK